MLKAISIAPRCTFKELKERGDRAMAEGKEAIRGLHLATFESQRLRDRIDEIHHRNKPITVSSRG
jgi:hypothetical protein